MTHTPREIIATGNQIMELFVRSNVKQSERICLMCNKPFFSQHAGHRRCPNCSRKIELYPTYNVPIYKTTVRTQGA